MKTKKMKEFLRPVIEALPEEMQECLEHSGDYVTIPDTGHFEIKYGYDHARKPEAVMLHLRTGGSRRFPIRKDGTLNVKRIVELVVPVFEMWVTQRREWDEEQAESNRRHAEAERVGPIVLKKVKLGRLFEADVDNYVGGFKLKLKSGKSYPGDVWAVDENTVRGTIPFGPMSITKLNEILKLLSKKEV